MTWQPIHVSEPVVNYLTIKKNQVTRKLLGMINCLNLFALKVL